MFRQMKVDIAGMVENMSYFVCPHCQHEVDIFSRGGAEKTARQFNVEFLGSIQLDPEIRKAGDEGKPAVLEGEDSPHAKALFEFARHVAERVEGSKAQAPESVIQIQSSPLSSNRYLQKPLTAKERKGFIANCPSPESGWFV